MREPAVGWKVTVFGIERLAKGQVERIASWTSFAKDVSVFTVNIGPIFHAM